MNTLSLALLRAFKKFASPQKQSLFPLQSNPFTLLSNGFCIAFVPYKCTKQKKDLTI